MPLLGRPVFIREVSSVARCREQLLNNPRIFQDRENESRFGATPVPGKIGMAMAGRGLHAGPPPRPASHNAFGANNPGNQLYVGNVSYFRSFRLFLSHRPLPFLFSATLSSRLARFERPLPVGWQHYPSRYQHQSRWPPEGIRYSHLRNVEGRTERYQYVNYNLPLASCSICTKICTMASIGMAAS
jgi:hypothetical protein